MGGGQCGRGECLPSSAHTMAPPAALWTVDATYGRRTCDTRCARRQTRGLYHKRHTYLFSIHLYTVYACCHMLRDSIRSDWEAAPVMQGAPFVRRSGTLSDTSLCHHIDTDARVSSDAVFSLYAAPAGCTCGVT